MIDRFCMTHRSTYSPQGDDPSNVCLARLTDRHDTPGECVETDLMEQRGRVAADPRPIRRWVTKWEDV